MDTISKAPKYNISLIVAVASNLAIGLDNKLLWHISDDLRRFKSLTSGHAVIMGKNTFLSLPRRPLPHRRNIVLTHEHGFQHEGVDVVHSLAEAMQLCEGQDETFVIGGASIYRQFMPFVSRLYVTWVYSDFEADAFFSPIDETVFRQESISERYVDENSGLSYAYAEYQRITPPTLD